VSVIGVTDLRRTYVLRQGALRRRRRHIQALRGISFEVGRGELFGLVGPNGAGKTTTVRILSTLLEPTSGRAEVLGLDVARQARQIRPRIGILFGGERGLYGRVSAWHNLRYFANLYGLGPRHSERRIAAMLELVGLSERANDRVDTYSRGMKQRLHIARALLHEPEVLFLDEPTIGLDPIGAREIRALILQLRQEGHAILLTTHNMLEADELCDRVAVIARGELVAIASPRELRRHVSDLYVVEIPLRDPSPAGMDVLRRLVGPDTAVDLDEEDGVARLQSARWRALLDDIPATMGRELIGPLVVREPTLEDVYVRLVGAAGAETLNGSNHASVDGMAAAKGVEI
jgi:ABC-2 type transport system ATP-binding protein